MKRISYPEKTIGLANDILGHIEDIAKALPRETCTDRYVADVILVKAERIEQLLKEGVIND